MDFGKIGFSETVNFQTSELIKAEFLEFLPNVIYKKTGYNYSLEHADNGCFLKPSFDHMSNRNSFVPEVNIDFQDAGGQHFLRIKGQPVKDARIFMKVWIAFALLIEIIGIIAVVITGIDRIVFAIFPAILALFGYSLCKIVTKITFKSVLKIIQNELSCEGVLCDQAEKQI